jgi:arylsulfatase A-like enzyme
VIPAGTVNETVAGGWDVLPTLAEFAGQPRPANIDGLSLATVLRGGRREREHPFLYWDYGHVRESFLQAVRSGNWKAVRNSITSPIELYDLAADPGETRDRAPQEPVIVERMAALMARALVPSPDYPIKSPATAAGR